MMQNNKFFQMNSDKIDTLIQYIKCTILMYQCMNIFYSALNVTYFYEKLSETRYFDGFT